MKDSTPKTLRMHGVYPVNRVRTIPTREALRANNAVFQRGVLEYCGLDYDALMKKWEMHLEVAEGYLELGMFDDAAMELEEIPPQDKIRNEVMACRLSLYMLAKKWEAAAIVGRRLIKAEPENVQWWIDCALCVRRAETLEEAERILLLAAELHPKEAIIRYNLTCYASVSGNIETAKKRWRETLTLDKDLRLMAFEDPDLRPIWDSIAKT